MVDTRPLAMVTGASSGIGWELAKLLAADGYDLVLVADEDSVHTRAEELGSSGTSARAIQVDLRVPDDVDQLYYAVTKGATDGTARLDVAVLNAGAGRAGPFIEGDLQTDLGIIDLNVRSTTQLAKLVLRDMAAHGAGKVLFTSSVAAAMPGSLQSVYNASKAFVLSLSEALHDEFRDTNITVTALMPGPTDTNFFRRSGMSDTVVGQMSKDDPADVAKQGYEALMSGRRKVVAESVSSKALGLANRVLPDSVKAAASRLISSPAGRH
ncbi:oxidoreductase [Mycolicibacterium conceptionense]|uniref:Oxidoreductase n=1 Tax=Mycolicibacterium conceptionense TaxID=451644 RepID=A0A1A0PH96_9MYCO|nr:MULTISPECIES: SDR family NAD(P)-dependent oxidoreductase [Mycolicibacterium]MCW1822101.1 SDR family NAD(P)-dependent oxidoreductase [Mycolicibacterium senegalense]OBB09103.1 oxidoreductase [Mycolicibacterium conceptionense]OBE94286.1 oxidoreductase [Mycolicibacterium conceptionense]OBF21639.1 oxidoreductase [Mycolicibacterium conceptionense]OBF45895.1 oxidoreductase [Mycolicibacterium conceptionense]